MGEANVERRLAAIMFTDNVGYAVLQDYGAAHMERCRGGGRKNAQPRTSAGASSAGG